jgi:hypothetical protein
MKIVICFLSIFIVSLAAPAQSRSRNHSTATYDLGLSTGNYSDHSYTEIQGGLNWYLLDSVAWRNALFTRFGSEIDSASGLDTSLRYVYNSPRDERGFGVGFFAGPGYRISNKENSGLFGEAGATVKAGGFAIGGGVKSISYSSPGKDSRGVELSKSDTVVFLILAGGGAF